MGIAELQQLASSLGLKEFGYSDSEVGIIRSNQKHRGEEACFSTDKRYTCTGDCVWRSNCNKLRAVWLR